MCVCAKASISLMLKLRGPTFQYFLRHLRVCGRGGWLCMCNIFLLPSGYPRCTRNPWSVALTEREE